MTAQFETRAAAPLPRYWIAALGGVALAYLAVFLLTREASLTDQLKAVARNAVSLALAAALFRLVVTRWVMPLSGWRMWLAHAGGAAGFSLLWYWLLTLAAAMFEAGSATRFSVLPYLTGAAGAWQLLQGLFAYLALAALTELERRLPAHGLVVINDPTPEFRERFLVRDGEQVGVLHAGDIVSITGADDYSEVVTAAGAQLVSTTLAEFEASLDPSRFLRVHRSAIANLDHVEGADPMGGGRMVLRMRAGPVLPVSRTGARRLREQLI